MLLRLTLLAGLAAAFDDWSLSHNKRQAVNCSDLELVIARGTNEPVAPTYGIIVGDPLFTATQAYVKDVTGYKVNYPADLSCDSRWIGVNDTLNHLNTMSRTCPGTSFVLVGYSQGAELMHYVGGNVSTNLYQSIVGLVMFGDPGNRGPKAISPFGGVTPAFPDALAQKLKENCAVGDPVCTNDGTNGTAHLSYSLPGTTFIEDSAKYIMQQIMSHGGKGPEPSPNRGPDEPTPQEQEALYEFGQELGGAVSQCSTFPGPPATSTATATATSTGTATTTPAVALVTPAAKMRF